MAGPLEGQLIRLRAKEPDDAEHFFRWINDPEVARYLAARYPMSMVQERDFVAGTVTYQEASFTVVTLAEARPIGSVALRGARPEARSANLAIMIGEKEYWGRGYGADTMRTACRFGFESMNLHRIELEVFAEHTAARKLYERIGFREEGIRRDAHFKFGRYFDAVMMSLLEGELR